MPDNQDIKARLDGLESEIRELRSLIMNLEARMPAQAPEQPFEMPVTEPLPAAFFPEITPLEIPPDQRRGKYNKTTASYADKWDSMRQEGLENLIGGRLLNRIGIIVLLFAAGYFLKYSFDNNWIGPAGRIIIGYVAGIGFLAAGHVLMNRGYAYFSQGFSGGALGIIYLSTFFAVGSYHLIDRMPAFAILAVAAAAGGILAVRQSAYGVAFLAAVGGFMAPFLIGRAEPNTVGLFSYIAVLNLGVLYIARYKNWRSLNMLAFFATIAVYIAYKSTLPYDWNETWLFQGYATLFFGIFGALAFIYNARNQEPTRVAEVFLLTLNAFAYFIASYENLDASYHYLLGPLAVLLAASYLAVSYGLTRQNLGDRVLHIALLGTGLSFVTAAIPLQLQDEWITVAWLVEAGIVFYGGTRGRMISLRIISMLFAFIISIAVFSNSPHEFYYYYDRVQPFSLIPVFNYYFLSMLLAVAVAWMAAYLYHTGEEIYRLERHLTWPAAVLGTIYALITLSSETVYALHYSGSNFSPDFAVSISWVALAILVLAAGMIKEVKGVRFLALGLFGVIICKVMLFDLSSLPIILRVLILLIVGAILVAVSFIYQRKSKEDQQEHD